MKYIKYRDQFLNEAFSAKSLSRTLGWLSKSGLKNKSFLNDLKDFCESNKIKMSDIEDNFFKVNVRRKDALLLNSDEVNNPSGLWCIKFWFSATDGYKGYTVTTKEDFDDIYGSDNVGQNNPFNNNEVEYLIDTTEIYKKGELHPVVDYDKLKTGDVVCMKAGNREPKWGKIFKSYDENGDYRSTYFINPDLSGNSPSDWYDENGNYLGNYFCETDIFDGFGEGFWHIYRNSPGEDHSKLHLYVESDKPLHVVNNDGNENNKINLSICKNNRRLYMIDNYPSDYNMSINKSELNDSDFAIIFYLDDFLAHQEEDLSDVRKKRVDSKQGATALMTDEEIKSINVKRRIEELVKRFNLSDDINNITNLKTIVLNMLIDEWALFTVFNGYNSTIFYRLYEFFEVQMDKNDNKDDHKDDEYYKIKLNSRLEDVKVEYKNLILTKTSRTKKFNGVYNRLLETNNDLLLQFAKDFMRLSIKLRDKIRSKELNSLYDAQILIDRISVLPHPSNDTFRLPYEIREGLDYFQSLDNSIYYFNQVGQGEGWKRIIDRAMNFIERQIDQL